MFDSAKVLAMRQTIAEFLMLALALIRVEIKAGSVIVEATVEVPAADAESKKAELVSGFGSAELLSSQLNVTALSEPVIVTQTSGAPRIESVGGNKSGDNLSAGVITAIILLVLAFAILVPLLVYYHSQKSKKDGSVVTVKSNTKQVPPSRPDSL